MEIFFSFELSEVTIPFTYLPFSFKDVIYGLFYSIKVWTRVWNWDDIESKVNKKVLKHPGQAREGLKVSRAEMKEVANTSREVS